MSGLSPELPEKGLSLMRNRRLVAFAAALALAASTALAELVPAAHTASRQASEVQLSNSEANQADKFLRQAGQSLINLHEASHGGWRFKSEIQSPHYQTDRDVGAASVGMGFLAMAEKYPNDPRWLQAAEQTATWLSAVSSPDGHGGRYWHDHEDDNSTSPNVYTSFDDGAIGIGDFFWQLYVKTNNPDYKKVSLETLQWTFSQAETFTENGITGYRWRWDTAQKGSTVYMGMGEGSAGIINTFGTYYERLKASDPKIAAQCKQYAEGGLRGIEAVRKELAKNIGASHTIPETGIVGQDGDTNLNSGYLSGAAGTAYMYLNLHRIFGNKEYLAKAEETLGWLGDSKHGPMVKIGNDSAAWKLALDPQSGNNNTLATGFEEGAAGIGWTYLQAYYQTGNKQYLNKATSAGNWLMSVAIERPSGGLAWHEDEHPTNGLVRPNLNNGAAGIGMFLHDLAKASGNNKYQNGAEGALKWLMSSAKGNSNSIYWSDNDEGNRFSKDPSWHWGTAGIIEAAQRINGGKQDIPGEQPSLPGRTTH